MTGCHVTADLNRWLARQDEQDRREAYENQVARELAERACREGDARLLEKLIDEGGFPEALGELLSLALRARPEAWSEDQARAALDRMRRVARQVRSDLSDEGCWYALQDEVAEEIRAREEAMAEARWEAAQEERLWGSW